MSPTYRFREIKETARRSLTCPTCGKRFTRQRTFTHTVNPFNVNADGTTKTPAEVRADVQAEAKAWEPDLDHCEDQA